MIAVDLARPGETLIVEPGAEADFKVQDGPPVTAVSQVGGQLRIDLLGGSSGTDLRYFNTLRPGRMCLDPKDKACCPIAFPLPLLGWRAQT